MTERPRCMALTAKGDQCANRAKTGSDYCGAHSGNIGRPTKLTPELIHTIETAVESGAFYEDACIVAGINKSTLYRWREQGEADIEHGRHTLEADFCTALTRGSAAAEVHAAEAVAKARFHDWRAAAWYLERRNPARWGRREQVEHSGSIRTGEPVIVEAEGDAAAAVARILRDAEAVQP